MKPTNDQVTDIIELLLDTFAAWGCAPEGITTTGPNKAGSMGTELHHLLIEVAFPVEVGE